MFFLQELHSQHFIVKSFDYNNGLISGANHFTLQDSIGFYWTCCYGGLVRFDGSTFKAFKNSEGLVHYDVNHIFEKKKNDFILCNQYSLLHFDGQKISSLKNKLNTKYKFERIIRFNDAIICNTNKGALILSNEDSLNAFYIQSEPVKSLFQYSDDYYFINHRNELRKVLDDQPIFLANIPSDLYIKDIADFEGQIYLTTNKGVYCLQTNQCVPFELNGQKINSIYQDQKGRMWYTDAQHQLWLKHVNGFEPLSKKYNTKEVIEPQYMEDRNGNLVVTSLYGLTIYKENFCEETMIKEIDNTEFNYNSSLFGIDTICVGINQQGFVVLVDHKKMTLPLNTSNIDFEGKTFRCEIEPTGYTDGKLIRISRKGIYLYQGGSLKPFSDASLENWSLNAGYYDSRSKAYYNGNDVGILYKISPHKIDQFSHPAAKGLFINSIQSFPNGSLIFMGTHEKLFRLSNNDVVDITAQLKTSSKTFSVFVHKKTLWLVVHGVEIQVYDIRGNDLHFIRRISKLNGLADANIAGICFDERDNLWLNTFSGVYYLKITGDSNVYCKKIFVQQGSTNAPMINHLFYVKQHLYATGIGGVMNLDVNKVLQEYPSYQTYFSSVKVNNAELDILQAQGIVDQREDVYFFPTHYNSILFQCNAVYYGFDDAIQFQYQLNEGGWKHLMGTHTIHYSDLGSGTYTLQVKAINKLNPTFFTRAVFKFVIHPPYWKTWWFRGLMVLCSVSCIYWFIKRRDAIKEKENKWALQMSELKLTALQSQMNPHFIFNSMNSIQNYIMQQKPIEAARYLSKFSLLMRRILDQSFEHSAPLTEIIDTLKMYLELESYRFNHGFTWHIEVKENVETESIKLPAMLLQPFVENAIIHGLMPKDGDKRLTILFEEKNNCLYCLIEDNGVGFREQRKTEKTHISRGQKLIEDMLQTMKDILQTNPSIETLHHKDEFGKSTGTTISIAIPLNKINQ